MSDLKLVAPDQPTPLERLLMDSVKNEAPSAEQRMRVREALGLSAVTVVPAAAAPKAAARVGTAGKIAIGSVFGASAVAALFFSGVLHRPAAQLPLKPVSAAVVTAPVVRAAPVAAQPVAPEPVISPLPPVENSPAGNGLTAKSGVRAAVSSGSKTPAPADSAADLSEQLRLIDRARSAIAAGNVSAATQALSSYTSKFPHGSFGQEAQVLRIETLDLQGNHAQAASLAKSFLAQHPNSPHVSLVQRIAGPTD